MDKNQLSTLEERERGRWSPPTHHNLSSQFLRGAESRLPMIVPGLVTHTSHAASFSLSQFPVLIQC